MAILWRGDREARRTATSRTSRFHRVFEALRARGIDAEPAVFADEMADEVRAQLLGMNGVLVWVDPLSDGQTRAASRTESPNSGAGFSLRRMTMPSCSS